MLDPNRDTPTAVTKSITEHGGLNKYDRPYWRVILAFNHTRPKRGLWHEFADGDWEQFTPEGHGKFRHNPLHALRVVDEVRDTPMWPIPNGWILERWFPAEVWGSRETWAKSSPYPEEGEYYLIAPMAGVVWTEMPDLNDLKQAISMWERDYLSRPRDFDTAYAVFVAEEAAAEEAEERKSKEEFEYFYQHEMLPALKESVSVKT
jgi:hypothetical protein